jgi:hypothetical protein
MPAFTADDRLANCCICAQISGGSVAAIFAWVINIEQTCPSAKVQPDRMIRGSMALVAAHKGMKGAPGTPVAEGVPNADSEAVADNQKIVGLTAGRTDTDSG